MRAIAKEAGCSRSVPERWIPRSTSTGSITGTSCKPGPKPGKRATKSASTLHGVSMMLGENGLSARKASKLVGVSPKTLSREAKRQGNTCAVGPRVMALTAHHVDERLKFARKYRYKYKGVNWRRVFFTDASPFYMHATHSRPRRRAYWAKKGTHVSEPVQAHSKLVMVYGGICCNGKSELIFVTGTSGMKSACKTKKGTAARGCVGEEYRHDVLPKLMAAATECFSGDGSTTTQPWAFQQDRSSLHASTRAIFEDAGVLYIDDWPAKIPDASPIENVWAIMKRRLEGRTFNSFAAFKRAVCEEWDAIDAALLARLCTSVPRRMQAMVRARGHMTKY